MASAKWKKLQGKMTNKKIWTTMKSDVMRPAIYEWRPKNILVMFKSLICQLGLHYSYISGHSGGVNSTEKMEFLKRMLATWKVAFVKRYGLLVAVLMLALCTIFTILLTL